MIARLALAMAPSLLVFVGNADASPVPEIDGGSLATALGVLVGGIALAAERLRRR